jgi:regulator of sigma E protease
MVVTIHEFGHFIVAKLVGIKVNEFAIGMGPRLLKWGKGETVYSLRALPVGGFCAMEGEDEGAPTPSALGGNADRDSTPAVGDDSRSFAKKKAWQRLLVIVAGAAMNLLLGFVLLLVYNGVLQEPHPNYDKVLFATTTIADLKEDTPAYQSGLRPQDTIIEINGRRILMDTDFTMEMQNDADGVLQMVVRREVDGETKKVELDAVKFDLIKDEESGQQYLKYDFILYGEERTLWNTITHSAKQEVSIATIVMRTLVDLIEGDYGINDLSGPVGTVDVIADVVGETVNTPNPLIAWQNLVFLMILITVNLGVFNLLPLPALDGGRLVFLIWEVITRKPVPQKYEALVHFVGIILLLLLMVFVTYSDITKLFA